MKKFVKTQLVALCVIICAVLLASQSHNALVSGLILICGSIVAVGAILEGEQANE